MKPPFFQLRLKNRVIYVLCHVCVFVCGRLCEITLRRVKAPLCSM